MIIYDNPLGFIHNLFEHIFYFISKTIGALPTAEIKSLTNAKIDENLVIQTYIENHEPEVSVNTVQSFSITLKNIDTTMCTQNAACPSVESLLTGYFRLAFNPNECGSGAGAEDNLCVKALKDDGVRDTEYQCGPKLALASSAELLQCTTRELDITNTTDIKTGLCEKSFMGDENCVSITKTTTLVGSPDLLIGQYKIDYSITFLGKYLRGKLPKLMIRTPSDPYKPEIKYNGLPINDMKDKTLADVTTWGNQPEEEVKITYYCEKRTQNNSTISNDASCGTIQSDLKIILENDQKILQKQKKIKERLKKLKKQISK